MVYRRSYKSFLYSFLDFTLPDPQVWLIVEFNNFYDLFLGYFTASAQWILHLILQSEWLPASTMYIWFSNIYGAMGPALFLGFYLYIIFFLPLTVFVGWVVNVKTIKFPSHLVLVTPPQLLAILSSIFLRFLMRQD